MDNGKVLSEEQAEVIFGKILTYPNYKIFVAIDDKQVIGIFTSAIIEVSLYSKILEM